MTIWSPYTFLGGPSGGDYNMNYLYGDGSDGEEYITEGPAYIDEPKNYTNFTLEQGVTLYKTTAGSPMIIYCTGTCEIRGTINLDGKGFQPTTSNSYNGNGYGCGEGSNSLQYSSINFYYPATTKISPNIAGITSVNSGGSLGNMGGSFDKETHTLLARGLAFGEIASMGGAGGSSYTNRSDINQYIIGGGGNGSAGGGAAIKNIAYDDHPYNSGPASGGTGGGGLFIFAKNFIISGTITANGTDAYTYIYSRYYGAPGGGGGGGSMTVICEAFTNNGTYSFSGGKGGGGTSYNNLPTSWTRNGGTGGYVIIKMPS